MVDMRMKSVEPVRLMEDESPRATELPDLMLACGVTSMTTAQIAECLGIPKDQVRQRMKPLRDRGRMVSPARGLWVPVPPERMAWGAPEPDAYLDDLMAHLGVDYYVGWLSAAALHGAAHQAPQRYQVATSAAVAERTVGRTAFEFTRCANLPRIPKERIVLRDGAVTASTPAATMLDLMEDTRRAGGIGNAVTAACELALIHAGSTDGRADAVSGGRSSLDDELLAASGLYTVGCLRRLGWALERYADHRIPDAFRSAAASGSSEPTPLVPNLPTNGQLLDRRWMLVVNADPEPDL